MACRKVPYTSRREAVHFAKRVGLQRSAYLCPYGCPEGTWHLSSKTKRQVKRSRKLGRQVKPHRPEPGLIEDPRNE